MARSALLLALLAALVTLAACAAAPTVVTWETASEANTAGFNVYRGPTADGPWTQVNATLIPPSVDPVRGGRYEFRDTTTGASKSSYYLLEEVELSGATSRYPPTRLQAPTQPGWLWWIAGAAASALAIGMGWWLGGRRAARRPGTGAPDRPTEAL